MSKVPVHVLAWLWQVVHALYPHAADTYEHVESLLQVYSLLRPRMQNWSPTPDAAERLLRLDGVIPVSFRGREYNFPINIWLPREYPHDPPFVFVVPTKHMRLVCGPHVRQDGRICHPYLANWSQLQDHPNLVRLIDLLRTLFSNEPPVKARDPKVTESIVTPGDPLRPSLEAPLQAYYETSSAPAIAPLLAQPQLATPPPLPPKGRAGHSAAPIEEHTVNPQSHCDRIVPEPPLKMNPLVTGHNAQPNIGVGYQHLASSTAGHSNTQYSNVLAAPDGLVATPPPVPSNPERQQVLSSLDNAVTVACNNQQSVASSWVRGLQAQRHAMSLALLSIENEREHLKSINSIIHSNADILRSTMAHADKILESSRTHPQPDIDALLVTPSKLGAQLWDLAAEEQATADTVFTLAKAMERGRMSASSFSKIARPLCREWFQQKALINKISRS